MNMKKRLQRQQKMIFCRISKNFVSFSKLIKKNQYLKLLEL